MSFDANYHSRNERLLQRVDREVYALHGEVHVLHGEMQEVLSQLQVLVAAVPPPPPPPPIVAKRVYWSVGPVKEIKVQVKPQSSSGKLSRGQQQKGIPDMSFTLTDTQEVTFSVQGTDAKGNPAPLTGTPAFAVDDSSILTLVDNGDGTGKVSAVGATGSATLSLTDTETDGDNFIGSLAFDVIAGKVTAASVVPGTPTEIAPVTPPVA